MSYRIDHLNFRYATSPVIDDVTLEIGAGEFVAIMGANGAGKSTLLKLMAGLIPPVGGSVAFMGRPIADYRVVDLARKLAFVPQETHVAFPFTAGEIVRMGRLPYRDAFFFDARADDEHVARAMALTETGDLANKTFTEISGGERQRVVLASALAQTPSVLLLDEPTVYLDMKHQLDFYQILTRLNRERGMTIVAVTHDINLAGRYAQRMIALKDGAVAADGTPREVLTTETLYEVFGIAAEILERSHGERIVIPSA